MDVDGEVDGKLAQAFGCMGTVDREVLVRQFQQILGPQQPLAPESCAFFLDMNNWNLQAALCSFYDLGATPPLEMTSGALATPTMTFVEDVTVGEGQSVPRSTRFVKTWRLRNPAPEHWPAGCFLKHIEGRNLARVDAVQVPALAPGEDGDVSLEMQSPSETGIYQSRWQLNTYAGIPFGDTIWCIIMVDEGGLLGITQQMASTTCGEEGGGGAAEYGLVIRHQPSPRPGTTLDGCLLMSGLDVDPPASPNGSSALYEAVAAAVPSWQRRLEERVTTPIDIPGGPPQVPPCTPSTPPTLPTSHWTSSSLSPSTANQRHLSPSQDQMQL